MKILISQARIINEDDDFTGDVLIVDDIITKVSSQRIVPDSETQVIHADGLVLLPGVIDDQVHFREPGLTHKGDLYTEPKAAVAGGCTTFMEMPNTVPSAVTQELLEQKYVRAAEVSLANFSFYIGTTNTNLQELLKTDPKTVCGVKIFMGSSTGDMLVDDPKALDAIFREVKLLITVHCEDDPMIKENMAKYREMYGDDLSVASHPDIRSREACLKSSSYAVSLAKKYNTRLHILHISTKEELDLFDNSIPLSQKRITSEACIHHMWFSRKDYNTKGNFIKWNPAVKEESDREAIFQAVLDDRIDVIATDHAPHTLAEKSNPYASAPSGGPLIQHSLQAMLEFHLDGKISLNRLVKKMTHNVADMFSIDKRGYIKEGYFADLVLVDLNKPYTVSKDNLLYKCGWSPFEGYTFRASVTHTFVNGHPVYVNGIFDESRKGRRISFNR